MAEDGETAGLNVVPAIELQSRRTIRKVRAYLETIADPDERHREMNLLRHLAATYRGELEKSTYVAPDTDGA